MDLARPLASVRSASQRSLGDRQFALIATAAIGFGVFLSGFVISEPAPYELYMAGLIPAFALVGSFTVSRATVPLLILLLGLNLGGLLALTQMSDLGIGPLYLCVSTFLALSAVFFASTVEADWRRLRLIFNAYLIAALATASLGILGSFEAIPGASHFVLYERAKGAFQDPNVFGPYLTLPCVFLMQKIATGRPAASVPRLIALGVLTLAVFLSFSRGAWVLYVLAMSISIGLLFLKQREPAFRLKIAILAVLGIAAMAIVVAIALQSGKIDAVFSERAELLQSYDAARLGRFARHILGLQMAMEHPLGIGPLVFGPIYGEDTHNIWLKTLLDYSWLGFLSYLAFVILTLGLGLKIVLRERPWQPYLAASYSVFIGHVAIGNVIDTDHWRHFYMIAGIIWGCVGLERRSRREKHAGDAALSP